MKKYLLTLNLQLFSDEGAVDSGVDFVPAAEESFTPQVEPSSESGADLQAAAEPEKQNNFEKAFAKRLAAEREKWQSEAAEKYKDYDLHKELSSWAQERTGADALSLKEQIELERLQNRADEQNVPPEVLKRIDELEAKAARADEYEQKQQEEQGQATYFSALNDFVKDKGIESEKLNQFMIENEMTYNPNDMAKSFNLAYKAMKADELEQKLATASEDAVKNYLASKQAPRAEGGNGAAGMQTTDTSKMSWKDLERRAAARLEASKTPQ